MSICALGSSELFVATIWKVRRLWMQSMQSDPDEVRTKHIQPRLAAVNPSIPVQHGIQMPFLYIRLLMAQPARDPLIL
jgi:hypothetical protein